MFLILKVGKWFVWIYTIVFPLIVDYIWFIVDWASSNIDASKRFISERTVCDL